MKSFTFDCGSASDKLSINLSQPMAKKLMLDLIEQINTGKPVLITLNGGMQTTRVAHTSIASKSSPASHEDDWAPF